ncbi:MAG: AzlD domain-containing protein [Pseudomonadales bacterium]|nr:AzlD domain-containing protein [Pseudomonadales bacterium]
MNNGWLILAMALVTFLPRFLPIAFAGKVKLPALLLQAFEFIPIAVLTVIITQTVFVHDGEIALSFSNHYLWATLVATGVALVTRSLGFTVGVGLLVFFVLRFIAG